MLKREFEVAGWVENEEFVKLAAQEIYMYEEKDSTYDVVCLLRKLGHIVMKTPTKKHEKHLHNVDGDDMTTSAMRKFLYVHYA